MQCSLYTLHQLGKQQRHALLFMLMKIVETVLFASLGWSEGCDVDRCIPGDDDNSRPPCYSHPWIHVSWRHISSLANCCRLRKNRLKCNVCYYLCQMIYFVNLIAEYCSGNQTFYYRLHFSLTSRFYDFYTVVIGSTCTSLAIFGVNQAQIQRAIACPNIRTARMWVKHYSLYYLCILYDWTHICLSYIAEHLLPIYPFLFSWQQWVELVDWLS